MKRLMWLCFFLVLMTAIGLGIKAHAGYLLISYGHWTVEIPLWLSVILLFILFIIFYYLIRAVHIVINLKGCYFDWRSKNRFSNTYNNLYEAIISFIEFDYLLTETKLQKSIKNTNDSIAQYALLAFVLHIKKDYGKRDQIIQKAIHLFPRKEMLLLIAQSRMQLKENQFDLAGKTLKRLKKLAPYMSIVNTLLAEFYANTKDWSSLHEILPDLRKLFSKEQLISWEICIYKYKLEMQDNSETLQSYWSKLPKSLRKNIELIYIYACCLVEQKQDNVASKIIVSTLCEQWNERLVTIYGRLCLSRPDKQLAIAEKWLKKHNDSAALLFALGKIAINFQHWNKAKEYLISYIAIDASDEAYRLLAYIYEQIGDLQAALSTYRHIK